MQAQTKRSPHVSDPVIPKVKEEGRQREKGHDPREDEEVNASGSKVQPPIQRPDGPEVALQSEEPSPSESDEPEPTPNPTIGPIQRPDDPPYSSSFSGKEDFPISREPDDPQVTANHTTVPIDREEPNSQAGNLRESGS